MEERQKALRDIDPSTNPNAYHELRECIESETKSIREAETADVDYLLQIMPYVAEYAIEASDVVSENSTLITNAAASASTTSGHLKAFGFKVTGTSKKLDVLQRYMVEIEGVEHASPYIQNIDPLPPGSRVASRRKFALDGMVCEECNVPTVLVKNEARVVCPSCGKSEPFVDFSEANMSFEEQIQMQQDASNYAYKRTSHFSEWLSNLQVHGRRVDVPQECLDALKYEFKKNRYTTVGDITPARVREFLRKLKLTKWYEHCQAIVCSLTGKPPPTLPSETEARLKGMFLQIQVPFERVIPRVAPTRRNFLSYSYTLHKLIQLIGGQDEFLEYLPLLKSSSKLFAQDVIWKAICSEPDVQWEFIPSI